MSACCNHTAHAIYSLCCWCQYGLTFRTTCCHILRSFRDDSGFSKTSAAPSSIPLHTSSVLLLFSDMRTNGRCETDSLRLPPSVASFARAFACTSQTIASLRSKASDVTTSSRSHKLPDTRAIYWQIMGCQARCHSTRHLSEGLTNSHRLPLKLIASL